MNRKMQRKSAIVLVTLALVCFLSISASVIQRRRRAESFLAEESTFQLRVTSLTQIEQLAARYDGHIQPDTCDQHGCAYFFTFDNGWLHRLHLAPYTRLTCTLGSVDRVLGYRRLSLTSGNGPSHGAFIEEWRSSFPEGINPGNVLHLNEPFYIRRQAADVTGGRRWRVFVKLTADATPEQHRITYDLNLECLSRIGGCEDAQQILPSVRWDHPDAVYQMSVPRDRSLSANWLGTASLRPGTAMPTSATTR